MKVKIFQSNFKEEYLQKEINAWLAKNKEISIFNITQSDSEINTTICIWYKDK